MVHNMNLRVCWEATRGAQEPQTPIIERLGEAIMHTGKTALLFLVMTESENWRNFPQVEDPQLGFQSSE